MAYCYVKEGIDIGLITFSMSDRVNPEEAATFFNSVVTLSPFAGISGPEIVETLATFPREINWDLYSKLRVSEEYRKILFFNSCASLVEDKEMISYYPNIDAFRKRKKVQTKIGKFVRFICHDSGLSDRSIEIKVNRVKELFPRKWDIKSGSSRRDFRHAYTHTQADFRDPLTTRFRKSLACSCMRYDNWSTHPAEYYASGDFTIYWLEEKGSGKIGARCVVGNGEAAPIYGVDDQSIDLLANHMEKEGIRLTPDDKWLGLSLLKLEDSGDRIFAAYLDNYPSVRDNGDSLTVDHEGSIDASDHEGYFYTSYPCCAKCGDEVDSDDAHNVNGDLCCSYCFNEEFVYCDKTGDMIPVEDSIDLDFESGFIVIVHYSFATETENGWCLLSEVVETSDGKFYHISEEGESFFLSSFSDEVYSMDKLEPTEDGEEGTKEELESNGYTFDDIDEVWVKPEEGEEECKTATA